MSDIVSLNETGTTALAPPPKDVSTRWAREIYPEAVDDFQKWLFSEIYYTIAEKNTATNGKANTMAEAIAQACLQQITVTHNLVDVTQRALIAELWHAQNTRWYTVLGSDYSSLSQVLKIALKDASESERYDLAFWMEYLLPALQYLGRPVDEVLNVPENFSKARAGVPTMRKQWERFDTRYRTQLKISYDGESAYWQMGAIKRGPFTPDPKEGEQKSKRKERAEHLALADYRRNFYLGVPPDELEEFGKELAKVIELIVSDKSVTEFKKEVMKIQGREPDPPAPAWMFQVKDAEYILIQSGGPKQTAVLEGRLSDLITELGVTDPMRIVEIANSWFASTRRKHSYYTLDTKECKFYPAKYREGIELLDPEGMVELARLEFAKAIPYIMQSEQLYVGLLEICPIKANTTANILRRFGLPLDLPVEQQLHLATEVLPAALVNLYAAAIQQAATTTLPHGVMVKADVVHFVTGFVTLSACCQVTVTQPGDTVT